jgi:hypothetical protein
MMALIYLCIPVFNFIDRNGLDGETQRVIREDKSLITPDPCA